MRGLAGLTLAAALPATIGGVVFWAVHGDTTLTRSIAYGFWFAAAAMFGLKFVAGSKGLWRRSSLPVPEGWVFVTCAAVLTALGAAIDAAGT